MIGEGQWQKLEIKVPDFPAQDLADIFNQLKDFVNAYATMLDLLLSVLQVIADPLAALLRKLIETLRANVESFLKDMGIYVLFVPIRKRLMTNFIVGRGPLGDLTPPIANELGIFSQPESAVTLQTPGVVNFLTNMNRMDGGNVGFYKTVVESLYDKGDIARPQFVNPDDYIGGVTLVMGTNVDMFGFLDDIQKLREMFGQTADSGMVPKIPIPSGLNAKVISFTNTTADVLLKWDPVNVPIYKLTDLGGLSLYPDKIAILRIRDDVEALKARSVEDLMGTRRLNTGDVFGPAEVLTVGNYSTFCDVTYLDKGVTYEPDESIYYAVAWRLQQLTAGDDLPDNTASKQVQDYAASQTDYWQISNIERVVPYRSIPASTPPDWHRTPSIAEIFPVFARLIRLIVAELDKLSERLASSLDVLSAYVAFLRSEVNRYEAIVTKILDLLAQMSLKFQMPTAGIYVRGWMGKGGNTYLLTDLMNSLSDYYPDSPPFHNGDEYVTGVIMLAGGPLPDVNAFKEGISLLFGQMSEDVQDLLERAESEATRAEEMQFLDDMTVGTPTTINTLDKLVQCTPQAANEISFNDDFTPKG